MTRLDPGVCECNSHSTFFQLLIVGRQGRISRFLKMDVTPHFTKRRENKLPRCQILQTRSPWSCRCHPTPCGHCPSFQTALLLRLHIRLAVLMLTHFSKQSPQVILIDRLAQTSHIDLACVRRSITSVLFALGIGYVNGQFASWF